MRGAFLNAVVVSSALALTNCGVEEQVPDESSQPTADIQSTTGELAGCYPVGTLLVTIRPTLFWWSRTYFNYPAGCTVRLVESCPMTTSPTFYKVYDMCQGHGNGAIPIADVALK